MLLGVKMSPPDRDPTPEEPVTAEWAGSHISIYDLPGILEDARENVTVIYDRSDFPSPIERIRTAVSIETPEGEDALVLKTIIHLDRTQVWNPEWLVNRFLNHLAPQ